MRKELQIPKSHGNLQILNGDYYKPNLLMDPSSQSKIFPNLNFFLNFCLQPTNKHQAQFGKTFTGTKPDKRVIRIRFHSVQFQFGYLLFYFIEYRYHFIQINVDSVRSFSVSGSDSGHPILDSVQVLVESF